MRKGGHRAFQLPRALPQKAVLDFSFSGLKTAVSLVAEKLRKEERLEASLSDLCASVQEAIVDALMSKIFLAIQRYQCQSLAIVGGVAANSRLRFRLNSEWEAAGLARPPFFPKQSYCTDNAAMIAFAALLRLRAGFESHVTEEIDPNLALV